MWERKKPPTRAGLDRRGVCRGRARCLGRVELDRGADLAVGRAEDGDEEGLVERDLDALDEPLRWALDEHVGSHRHERERERTTYGHGEADHHLLEVIHRLDDHHRNCAKHHEEELAYPDERVHDRVDAGETGVLADDLDHSNERDQSEDADDLQHEGFGAGASRVHVLVEQCPAESREIDLVDDGSDVRAETDVSGVEDLDVVGVGAQVESAMPGVLWESHVISPLG